MSTVQQSINVRRTPIGWRKKLTAPFCCRDRHSALWEAAVAEGLARRRCGAGDSEHTDCYEPALFTAEKQVQSPKLTGDFPRGVSDGLHGGTEQITTGTGSPPPIAGIRMLVVAIGLDQIGATSPIARPLNAQHEWCRTNDPIESDKENPGGRINCDCARDLKGVAPGATQKSALYAGK